MGIHNPGSLAASALSLLLGGAAGSSGAAADDVWIIGTSDFRSTKPNY